MTITIRSLHIFAANLLVSQSLGVLSAECKVGVTFSFGLRYNNRQPL